MHHGPIETAEMDGIGNMKDANATWFEAEIRSCLAGPKSNVNTISRSLEQITDNSQKY